MIQMVNLQEQYKNIKEEVMLAVEDVLGSSRYILGPRVQELEAKIAAYCGTGEALGVASGTDALHLSIAALGLGSGDEVITTPFTFIATVEAIVYESAKPVFVDIEPDTFNMDPAKIEERITSRTRAILPIHMFGHPADMDAIGEIAKRRGLKVIEDCAQSFGAKVGGKMTGSFGDAGCFSFYPSKNLGAFGDGGMITTMDSSLAETVRSLRNHGTIGNYKHGRIGFNSRLDELQAAILLVKLKRIDEYNDRRRINARLYGGLLEEKVRCPIEREGFKHVYHQYTIRSPRRDEIAKRLRDASIASAVYYPVALHLQEALSFLGHREGDFEVAESACREVLSLPMCPELKESEINEVARAVIGV